MANNALGLDGIRLSALTKASVVGKFVTDVTLGPNSKCADYDLLKNRSEVKCELGENFPPLSTKNSHASGDARNCNMNSCIDNVECAGGEDYSSLSTMKLLYDLDQQRQRKVKDLINERFRNMMKDSQIRQLEFDSKHQYLQHEIQAKVLQDEQLILRQLQEDEILADQRQQQLAQQHKKHTQRINELNEKIKEAERQKEAEEEERKIIKERKIQIDKVHHYYIEYRTKCEQIVEASRQCKDKQAFVAEFSDYASKLKSLNVAMDQLVGQCKSGEINNLDLRASEFVRQIDDILGAINKVCEKINKQHDKAAVEDSTAKQEGVKAQTSPSSEPTKAVELKNTSEDLNEFVDNESFNIYKSLQEHLQIIETYYENLQKDDSLKKFRFECQATSHVRWFNGENTNVLTWLVAQEEFIIQWEMYKTRALLGTIIINCHHLYFKAVNIPVNAISHISAEHLQDKLLKLSRLISGQPVEVVHSQIIASSHPEGIIFCKNLLAKKFVWQGEHTVSSKPEAAFAIAAVIEALWADFPDFGHLILGHFYRECPYLVPIFMPQVEGQSNEDYYRLLGYHYNENGEVEKQDKFLKRMSGIMRLYTAVLVTRPCRYQQNKSHPHGLKHAWHWISCILNMDPRPDICATLLYDFLEVAGSAMYCHYGRQFQKLLHLICKEYFPKIEKVTPSVSSGPVSRLQAFLQKILKQGHIPPPAGLLPSNFW